MMATLAGFSIRTGGDKRWQTNNVNDWSTSEPSSKQQKKADLFPP
jgi:hypothetical protein